MPTSAVAVFSTFGSSHVLPASRFQFSIHHPPHLGRARFAVPALAWLDPFKLCEIQVGPKLTICRALSISSQSSRFDAIPQLDAMQLRSTRNESYTPSWTGSITWPVVRFK